jgi:hypothetical protein
MCINGNCFYMQSWISASIQLIRDRVKDDLYSDPWLRYILLLSLFASGFWFWWRIPNFATVDEFHRIGQSMKIGRYLLNPSPETIKQAAELGIGKDASVYLHGLVLLPLFIAVVLMGELNTLVAASSAESSIALWNAVPAWFWTGAILSTRLLNVILVVGIIYLVYRIGTTLADRRAGRIASLFTTLSLAIIQTAHEVNEDTPALFLLLIVLYASICYIRTESHWYFLVGCGLGGVAIAFKLSAGVAVVFLGAAYILSASKKNNPVIALWKPSLLLSGFLIGSLAIYFGIPNLLLNGPEWIVERVVRGQAPKTVTSNPPGYSALLAYLNGFGLPLFIGVASGTLARIRGLLRSNDCRRGEILLFIGLFVYLVVFIGVWNDFKTHHVLLSIPLPIIPLSIVLSQYFEKRRASARAILIILTLSTALYAGAGLYNFTDDPRDEATDWLESETSSEATMSVFVNSPAKAGLVHGRPVDYYTFERGTEQSPGEAYTDWLLSTPGRSPEYIQTVGTVRNSDEHPRRKKFVDRLVNADHYDYTIVAEFGEPPKERSRQSELLYAGINPKIEQRDDYVVILSKETT